MDIRRLLLVNFGFKVFVVAVCILLVRTHYLLSDMTVTGTSAKEAKDRFANTDYREVRAPFPWFEPAIAEQELREAVEKHVADINARNGDGLTGLIWAAKNNDMMRAQAILNAYPKLNLISDDMYRRTALHWCCYNGDNRNAIELAHMLVDRGADVHVKDFEGATPLRLVARMDDINQNLDMVVFLAKHGARIGARDDRGQSLLHRLIVRRNQTYIRHYLDYLKTILNPVDLSDAANFAHRDKSYYLEELIDEAAKRRPDRLYTDRVSGYDEHGLRSLMQAVIRDDKQIVPRLLQNAAPTQDELLNDRSNDEFQVTALHIATMQQDVPWVELLLGAGADRFVQDAKGNTPLHLVAGMADGMVARNIVRVLLKGLDDPASLLNMRNAEGDTLAHRAIKLNNPDLIRFLADTYGQYIDHTLANNDNRDLMQLAQVLGRKDIEELLSGS